MRTRLKVCVMLIPLVVGTAGIVAAQEEDVSIYPTAILPFQERDSNVHGQGEKVSDLLFASLAAHERVYLVDRGDIDRLLQELELNLSGMVGPGQATQVGQMTGAKVLVTGSVMEADESFHIVAKIIGTETSRVLGESVKGPMSNGIAHLVEELAGKIAGTIDARAPDLVGKKITVTDRIAALKKILGDDERPTVVIDIDEQHIGRGVGDPTSATEIALFCKETGFEVIDAQSAGTRSADVILRGEGFSETATRHRGLVSVKARLEVEAVDRHTNKLIAVERQTAVVVDLSERIAGKAALQQAAAAIAERLLPKLTK